MTITSELRDQALSVAGGLDPEVMTAEQAAAVVDDLATAANAICGTLMFAALRVARSDAWKGQGHATAADWLASKAGISVAEAARQLGTAKRANDLPKTKEKMKKGKLSTDQASSVTDGASADPEAEDELLDSAEHDTNRALKEKAAKARAAATDSAERERRIRRNRYLRRGTDADGAFWARIYGPGMTAAMFDSMIKPFEELMFRHARSTGDYDTYENRSFDAFFTMLAWLQAANGNGASASGNEPADDDQDHQDDDDTPCGSDDEQSDHRLPPVERPSDDATPVPTPADASPRSAASPTGGSPPLWRPPWDPGRTVPLPTKLPGGNNTKVIVNVDHTALLRGHTIAGETCEIAGVGPISVEAVKEILATDPFLAVVVRKGRDVVNVAHQGRGLNAHQRTAIEATGIRCSNIACNRTVAIQMDHRIGYVECHETKLDNQDPLCTLDHERKTHHGWHLETGTGRRRFLPPGHPDNPLTGDRERTSRAAAGSQGPSRPLPPRRPLDPNDPADALELRIRARLAGEGTMVQPTLC